MTTPVFIDEDSYCSAVGGSTSASINVPATMAAGDVAVLVVFEAQSGSGGVPTISGVGGWTQRLLQSGSSFFPNLIYWTKVLDAADAGDPITITWGSNRSWSASVLVYRDALNDGSNPIGAVSAANNGTGTSASYSSITTTEAESLVIAHAAVITDQPGGFAVPSGFSERVDNSGTGQFRNHQISDRAYGSTGAKTPGATTFGTSSSWRTQSLELLPGVPDVQKAKVWDGSAWVPATSKVWSGSAWVDAVPKVWSGSAWE